jgi:hypothetical protein
MLAPQTQPAAIPDFSLYPRNSSRSDVSKRAAALYRQVLDGDGSTPYGKLDLFVEEQQYQMIHLLDYCKYHNGSLSCSDTNGLPCRNTEN